jgi:hypothetical protein
MNHPLRFGGQTFYQARMGRDEDDPQRGTSALQVVRNPSWLAPYVGFFVVMFGMFFQFGFHLVKFLNRQLKRAPAPAQKPA